MAGIDDRVTITMELAAGNLASQLTEIANKLGNVGEAGHRAGTHAAEGMHGLGGSISETVLELAKMATAFLTIEKGVEAVIEGFKHADAVRDLHASLEAVSTSAEAGTEAFRRLYEAAESTRATGHQLVEIYGRLLPTALDRGFKENQFQTWAAQLAKAAPAIGQSVDQVFDQFQLILAGRVRKTNLLAHALGLDPEAYNEGKQQLESAAKRLDELAEHGAKMGQSFASTFAKIKEGWLDAFAKGFNEARDGVTTGLEGMKNSLTDPEFLNSISTVGKTFAEWVPEIAKATASTIIYLKLVSASINETINDAQLNKSQELEKRFTQAAELLAGARRALPKERVLDSKVLGGAEDVMRTLAGAQARQIDEATGRQSKLQEDLSRAYDAVVGSGKKAGEAIEGAGQKAKDAGVHTKALGNELNKLEEIYRKTYDALLRVGPEQTTRLRAEIDALAYLSDHFEIYSKANLDTQKIADAWRDVGGAIKLASGDLVSFGGTLNVIAKKLPASGSPGSNPELASDQAATEQEKKRLELEAQASKERSELEWITNQKINAETQRVYREIFERYKREVITPLGDVFADLALSGGKNIGEILANSFVDTMRARSQDLASVLFDALGVGSIKKTKEGTYTYGGQPFTTIGEARAAQLKQSPTQAAIGLGVEAAGAFSQAYKTKGQTDVESAIQGVVSGVMTGNWISGIIVAVATYAGHLLQSSPSQDYQYGRGGIDKTGQAYFNVGQNVSKDQAAQWVAQWQQSFEDTYNGYVKVIAKFHTGVFPLISKIFDPVLGRVREGIGDIGLLPHPNFAKELDEYIKTGLPHQISDRFKSYLSDTFTAVGFSADRFGEIWSRLMKLDPKTAIAALGDLADAAIGFNKTLTYFQTPTFMGPEQLGVGNLGLLGQARSDAAKTFTDSLRESEKDIYDFADAVRQMVGVDQIKGAKDLAGMLTDRMNKEKQYLQGIAAQIEGIQRSAQQQQQTYALLGMKKPDGTPDYEAQAKYLRDQTNAMMSQLEIATSPEEVTRLYNAIASNIDKIYQAGSNLGPEAEKAYREWAQKNLTTAEEAALARQNQLAQKVEEANTRFVTAIQGFINAFEKATEALATPTGGGGGDRVDHGGDTGGDDERWSVRFSAVTTSVETVGSVTNQHLSNIASILAAGRDIRVVVVNEGGGGDGGRGSFSERVAASRGR